MAADPETGEVEAKRVVQTFENESDELVHVTAGGERITATPEHPFYVPQRGWAGAIELRAGDILVQVNGEYAVVEQIEHELLETPVTVYNFEVEGFHTYFVGDSGVLVHNLCDGKLTGYTKHGINQAISRDSVGVKPSAILDTIRNPINIKTQADAALKYIGKQAVVVVNKFGKIITTYAKGHLFTRY